MSEFAGKGFEEVPSLHIDIEYTMHELARLPDSRLVELKDSYTTFLSADPLSHHREQAERFLEHIDFEERYRAGVFKD